MKQLTYSLHDRWFEEPAARRTFPATTLCWKHLSKQYAPSPTTLSGQHPATAIAVVVGSLIANAQS
jgi:hypothetical protein